MAALVHVAAQRQQSSDNLQFYEMSRRFATSGKRRTRHKLRAQRAWVGLLCFATLLRCLGLCFERVRTLRLVSKVVENRILISYVYHESLKHRSFEIRNKRQNLYIFIKKAYIEHKDYTFVFTITGKWPPAREFFSAIGANEEKSILPLKQNIIVMRTAAGNYSDLCFHSNVTAHFQLSHGAFVFLNDGVRGPFTAESSWKSAVHGSWLFPFLKTAIRKSVSLVGAGLSCEIGLHVQTYFILVKREFISQTMTNWAEACTEDDWLKVIQKSEVGLSQHFLKQGLAISSPSIGDKLIFSAKLPHPRCRNPSLDYVRSHKAVMIKFGGEVYRKQLLNTNTLLEVERWTQKNFPYFDMSLRDD